MIIKAGRIVKKVCILMAAVFLFTTVAGISYVDASEEKKGIPTFSLKLINEGTGVKITINKTKGAEGYFIFLTRCKNKDSNYLHQDGEFLQDWTGEICYRYPYIGIKKDGTKKRTYTINGLPKGEYTFRIAACKLDIMGGLYGERTYSDFKSITIKAAPSVPRKDKNYDFSNVKVGDVIEFGEYEQDDNMLNGAEPIEWIVLSKNDKQMYLVSKYILDCLPFVSATYDSYSSDDGWEHPSGMITIRWNSLREWLNTKFFKSAFSKKERSMLKSKKVTFIDYSIEGSKENNRRAEINSKYYKVHMLSNDDLLNSKYGYSSNNYEEDSKRGSVATQYAIAKGGGCANSYWAQGKTTFKDEDMDRIGDYLRDSFLVSSSGSVSSRYIYAEDACLDYNGFGVRPAIYIKL